MSALLKAMNRNELHCGSQRSRSSVSEASGSVLSLYSIYWRRDMPTFVSFRSLSGLILGDGRRWLLENCLTTPCRPLHRLVSQPSARI